MLKRFLPFSSRFRPLSQNQSDTALRWRCRRLGSRFVNQMLPPHYVHVRGLPIFHRQSTSDGVTSPDRIKGRDGRVRWSDSTTASHCVRISLSNRFIFHIPNRIFYVKMICCERWLMPTDSLLCSWEHNLMYSLRSPTRSAGKSARIPWGRK